MVYANLNYVTVLRLDLTVLFKPVQNEGDLLTLLEFSYPPSFSRVASSTRKVVWIVLGKTIRGNKGKGRCSGVKRRVRK
ncbi:hypothetical protein CCHR01_19024 [Colletotrichum chrysophilum]|uniref:Uncharacterized protein n=1 Tax=Colletotrichum chrysophilum TaxID=1836956 RepID=A0AAD8ZZ04_9PEZI|nr:hypothetical protein CCHR01_19024 [Colletotrichum chrysophilum]